MLKEIAQSKLNTVTKKYLVLLGDTNDKFIFSLFNVFSKKKIFKNFLIIFSKKSKKKAIQKILKIFGKNAIYFKESFPHRNKEIINILKNNQNTLINLSFPNRLRKSFLNLFNCGSYNIHPSLIQHNRGCHSIFWSIYNDNDFGCTLHELTPYMDQGKIFDQIVIKNKKDFFAYQIYDKVHLLRSKILKRNLHNIKNEKLKGKTPSLYGRYYNKKDILKVTNLKFEDKINLSTLYKIIRGTAINDNGFNIIKNKSTIKIKLNYNLKNFI
jgi:methionyl-tRNA formyltransferase